MHFNFVLSTSLLLALEVLAIPPGLAPRVARYREGRQSQPVNTLKPNEDATVNTLYSTNWAGAVWDEGAGTFNSVTGTFVVPNPTGSPGASAAAWVGIDGYTCQSAILQTGVDFTVNANGPATYHAWFEWYPAYANNFDGISISAGDTVRLTVTATSATSGSATVENLTKNQAMTALIKGGASLCMENAEWIVEDYISNNEYVDLADFGSITFSNAQAGSRTPSGAGLIDMENSSGQVVASSSTPGSTLIIRYV